MKCVFQHFRALLRPDDGMTLLEVTFASGILAMALSLLFGSLISITLVARINEDRALADTELSSVMEKVGRMPLETLLVYQPPSPARPGVKRAISLVCFDREGAPVNLPLPQEDGETAELPDLPNPLEVQAVLLWSAPNGHVFQSTATTLVPH